MQNTGSGVGAPARALSDAKILAPVLKALDRTLRSQGREGRQVALHNLAGISRAWLLPVNRLLYRNPFLGNTRRAASLLHSITTLNKSNGELVEKLILGEGSDGDIEDWPSPTYPAEMVRACPNVKIFGFSGLEDVDLVALKDAVTSAERLEEIRSCDLLPHPWRIASFFFQNLGYPSTKIRRLRLFSLESGAQRDGWRRDRPGISAAGAGLINSRVELSHAAFNYCAIEQRELLSILAGSSESLRVLSFEGPRTINHRDLVSLLDVVGRNLEELVIEDFADTEVLDNKSTQAPTEVLVHTSDTAVNGSGPFEFPAIDHVLAACPNLQILDFADGMATVKSLRKLVGSRLRAWRFVCDSSVRPHHWSSVFQHPAFPPGARCRVICDDWSEAEVRACRIEAWKYGLAWLSNGESASSLRDDLSD